MTHSMNFLRSLVVLLIAMPLVAGTISQYPTDLTLADWPTTWTALPSLNDSVNGSVLGRLDFVGDASDPGAYWAADSSFFYIRMRMNVSTVPSVNTYADTVFIYVDRVGWGNEDGRPDYAFAWDSKSTNKTEHGLELQVPPTSKPETWADLNMSDIDGSKTSKKTPPDFNLTGDGYLRTVDGIATENFGNTTYIDVAVSWPFLSAIYQGNPVTSLESGQTWRIALGSLTGDTDHGDLNADIAGGASLNNNPATAGWSSAFEVSDSSAIPEPSTMWLFGIGLLGVGIRASRRRSV